MVLKIDTTLEGQAAIPFRPNGPSGVGLPHLAERRPVHWRRFHRPFSRAFF